MFSLECDSMTNAMLADNIDCPKVMFQANQH